MFSKYFLNYRLLKNYTKHNNSIFPKNSLYVSVAHSKVLIEKYLYHLNEIFLKLGKFDIRKVEEILREDLTR